MNADIKAKWVSDLRSGRFPQGANFLNKGGKCCVLGVLCEEAADAGIVSRSEDSQGAITYVSVDGDTFSRRVPIRPVLDWAGITPTGAFVEDSVVGDLMNQNDVLDRDFNELADYIEENL